MKPSEYLRAARAKIEKFEHWTQGADSRDRQAEFVRPKNPTACCWCARGALIALAPEPGETLQRQDLLQVAYDKAHARLDRVAHVLFDKSIIGLNDGGRHVAAIVVHANVLRCYDVAAESLEKEGQ